MLHGILILTLLAAARAAAQPAGDAGPTLLAGPEGFAIQSQNGDYRLQLRGYTHFDGRFYAGDEDALGTDAFLFRRVRPVLQATLAKHFEFVLMPDFGGGTAVLQDAYLDVRYSSKLRVRAGKFKAPVGLERLQSATAISFVERALVSSVMPIRDMGVQVHGELGGGVVVYAAGVFNGAPDGASVDSDTNDAKDLDGRIFVSPFRKPGSRLEALGFGVGASNGRHTGALPGYRSGGQLIFFSYNPGVAADGSRTRISPQLSFHTGRLGIVAEYVRARGRVSQAGGATHLIGTQAWQTTASVALTNDSASFTGLRPKRPFDPASRHWGALELVARVNALEVDDAAFRLGLADPERSARKAFAWATGLNWYLNRHVKQVLSYERTRFTGGRGAGDRDTENAIFARTQVAF